MDVLAEDDVDPRDIPLGRDILHILHTVYPGWAWVVEIPRGQNIVNIRNLSACPRGTYGFRCHKDKLTAASLTRAIVMAGGEFLERFRMRRGAFREEEVKDRPKLIFEKPET